MSASVNAHPAEAGSTKTLPKAIVVPPSGGT
jgi:hypothetical protein